MLYTKAQAILLGLLYCFSSLSKIHIAFCNGAYIDEFFDYWNPKRAGGIIGLRKKKKTRGAPYG
jgi:hypothetical protein